MPTHKSDYGGYTFTHIFFVSIGDTMDQRPLSLLTHNNSNTLDDLIDELNLLINTDEELDRSHIKNLREVIQKIHQIRTTPDNKEMLNDHFQRECPISGKDVHICNAFFYYTSQGYLYTNQDLIIQFFSPSIERLLGYEGTFLVGKKLSDLLNDYDPTRLNTRTLAGMKEKTFSFQNISLVSKDKTVIPGDLIVIQVSDANENLLGYLWEFHNLSAQKQVLNQLAFERNRLKAIINNAPEAIVVVDQRGRIMMTNPAADQLHVRDYPDPSTGERRTRWVLCYSDGLPYRPEDVPLTRSALTGQVFNGLEVSVLWPNGKKHYLLLNSAPVLDGNGQILGAVGVFKDITELKASRGAVRRYMSQLQLYRDIDRVVLMSRSIDHLVSRALKLVILLIHCDYVSLAFEDDEKNGCFSLSTLGIKDEKINHYSIDRSDWDCFREELIQSDPVVIPDVNSGNLQSKIAFYARQQGVRSCISYPLMSSGDLLGILTLGRKEIGDWDVEERETINQLIDMLSIGTQKLILEKQLADNLAQAEELVRQKNADLVESRSRYRGIFEKSAMGILTTDEENRILEINPAFLQILGYRGHNLIGMKLTMFIHPEDIDKDQDDLHQLLQRKTKRYATEKRFVNRQGKTVFTRDVVSLLNIPASPIKNKDKYVLLHIIEDITAQKEAQIALIQAEKMAVTGKIASSLAHEINNPLQAAVGCLGLVEDILKEGGDVSAYLTVAKNELMRAGKIVGELRDMIHRRVGEHKEVNLYMLAQQVGALIKKKCMEQNIELTLRGGSGLPPVLCDPDLIHQVFLNLMLNAIDAMPNGGKLSVSFSKQDDSPGVYVRFRDTGVGIPQENLSRIFDAFFSTKVSGLGLGLANSKKIISEHNGKIFVRSKVNVGTVFTVWLPLSGKYHRQIDKVKENDFEV